MAARYSSPLLTLLALWLASSPTAILSATRGSNDFGIPQVAKINEEIRESWEASEMKPSQEATEGEWCRRV